jgi:prevent-host-death family protein
LRHYDVMAEPAAPLPPQPSVELSLIEARTRLTQIVRRTPVTGQVTVITDRGRPVAAIVPVDAVQSAAHSRSAAARIDAAAAGWMRRIEQVRVAMRRQHATRTARLEHALAEVWSVLDRLRPHGCDRAVDELRIAHRDVLSEPPPLADPLTPFS